LIFELHSSHLDIYGRICEQTCCYTSVELAGLIILYTIYI